MDPKQLAGGIVLAGAGIAGFLVLVLTGHEDQVDKFLAFIGPSIAALLIIGHQGRRMDTQDRKLETIEKQTNGVLDRRIQEGTTKAVSALLEAHGVIGPPSNVDVR